MNDDRINKFANSLKAAKAIMNKVEGQNFDPKTPGNITEEYVDNMIDDNTNYLSELSQEQMVQSQKIPKRTIAETYGKSKMPKAILDSFMDNPPIDPTAPFGHELMMTEIAKKAADSQQAPKRQIAEQHKPAAQQQSGGTGIQLDTKLIEYIVKKTVEETIEQISKKSNINENFRITIGDKTFGGSLTTLNETTKATVKK